MSPEKTSIVTVDPEKCNGCRLCELACAMMHHGRLSPRHSRIQVLDFGGGETYVPVLCQACENAPCIDACPMNARRRRDDGAVDTEEERCIGCRACLYICPMRGPVVDPDTGKTMSCDRCADAGGEPWCVKACRDQGALQVVAAGRSAVQKTRERADQLKTAYTPQTKK
jgi:Fe-S-cluster-containing dehydrogenase component